MDTKRLLGTAVLATGLAACAVTASPPVDPLAQTQYIFFDDFSQPNVHALEASGWTLRRAPGHPGIPGAQWGPGTIALVPDTHQSGNQLLRLQARTDGRPGGTVQAQICHTRKYLEGTYAARIRFSDEPVSGDDGDVVVQSFYTVSPLRYDFDPEFSEVDFEYLPNGGWGSPCTRLYSIAWQTVRVEPWDAHNAAKETFAHFAGWHWAAAVEARGA